MSVGWGLRCFGYMELKSYWFQFAGGVLRITTIQPTQRFRMNLRRDFIKIPLLAAVLSALALPVLAQGQKVELLNVSYDPTRELYVEFNQAFARYWKGKTGQDVTIKQSHGGSGKQARSIIDGPRSRCGHAGPGRRHRRAGEKRQLAVGRLAKEAAQQLVALHVDHRVRGAPGQPQGHQGLGRPDQARRERDHPQPQDLGRRPLELPGRVGVRQAQVRQRCQAKEFVAKLYGNVPILDTGARGSTITFAQRAQGDVLLAWENEAYLLEKEFGAKFDIVAPSISILAEPAVAVVDKVVDKKGTRAVARGIPQVPVLPKKARTLRARTSIARP